MVMDGIPRAPESPVPEQMGAWPLVKNCCKSVEAKNCTSLVFCNLKTDQSSIFWLRVTDEALDNEVRKTYETPMRVSAATTPVTRQTVFNTLQIPHAMV